MKILVVDDEQDICEILQYNLENEGYEVVTANSAEEALKLPLQEFALILYNGGDPHHLHHSIRGRGQSG